MSRLFVRLKKLARALVATRVRPVAVRRILIAHNLLLGDTILLAPLFKAIQARYPEASCVVLVRPAYLPLFASMPYGVQALAFNRRDAQSQSTIMQSGPYDLALVPDDNRYAWLARASNARWVVGFADDRPAWKNAALDVAVPYRGVATCWADLVTDLIDAVRPIGADSSPAARLPYRVGEWPAPDIAPDKSQSLPRPDGPYVVLHVGASTPLKEWPAPRWRSLADECAASGYTIVWSGGQGEQRVLLDIGCRVGEIDTVGTLDLVQIWHLIAGAALLLCPDTGVAHLARVIGTPTVALFGPGSTAIHGKGIFFGDARYQAVTVLEFPCRDQHRLYRRELGWVKRCGRSYGVGPGRCNTAGCMQAIHPDSVRSAVAASLPG